MDLKNKKTIPLPKFVENATPITPKKSQIKSYSLYNKPIDKGLEDLKGNSRRWGDASSEVKRESMSALLNESMKRGLSKSKASFVLATSYVESGFNPDAAASSTSAGGLGQFVKKTARACGLDGMEVFDVKEASSATVRYIKNIFDKVTKKEPNISESDLFVDSYSHYHDGGIINSETEEKISRAKVLPLVGEFETWIDEMEGAAEMEYFPRVDESVVVEDMGFGGCRI